MTTATPDETPKASVAKKVVTPKRRYFIAEQGLSVLAHSLEEAVKLADKSKAVKEGDGQ